MTSGLRMVVKLVGGSEGAVYVFDKQKSIFVWLMMLEMESF